MKKMHEVFFHVDGNPEGKIYISDSNKECLWSPEEILKENYPSLDTFQKGEYDGNFGTWGEDSETDLYVFVNLR